MKTIDTSAIDREDDEECNVAIAERAKQIKVAASARKEALASFDKEFMTLGGGLK